MVTYVCNDMGELYIAGISNCCACRLGVRVLSPVSQLWGVNLFVVYYSVDKLILEDFQCVVYTGNAH